MSDPYLGQIYLVGYNFAARGFAMTNGQLIAISQNSALFSLLGTTFGGDGRTSFGLPDLRGRTPIGLGHGPGLSSYAWGQRGGVESTTLLESQMPRHRHAVNACNADGDKPGPGGKLLAAAPTGGAGMETIYHIDPPAANRVTMAADMIEYSGGGQAQTNVQPFIAMNYQIAMQGAYPSRS